MKTYTRYIPSTYLDLLEEEHFGWISYNLLYVHSNGKVYLPGKIEASDNFSSLTPVEVFRFKHQSDTLWKFRIILWCFDKENKIKTMCQIPTNTIEVEQIFIPDDYEKPDIGAKKK